MAVTKKTVYVILKILLQTCAISSLSLAQVQFFEPITAFEWGQIVGLYPECIVPFDYYLLFVFDCVIIIILE
jgi:hypothetical protein